MKIIFNDKAKFVSGLFLVVLEVVVGILLLVLPAEEIINFCLCLLGILLIVCNAIPCLQYLSMYTSDKKYGIDLISSLISIGLGILLIVMPGVVLSIILACWFIIMPIVRIIIHPNHKEQFKNEIPLLVIGVLLSIFSFSFFSEILVKIIGVLVLIGAISHIIYEIKLYKITRPEIISEQSDAIDAEFKDL